MRFGRRNKLRPPNARDDKKPSPGTTSGTVASEERNALLAQNQFDSEADLAFDPQEPDPTQALLTALGRFQRQVARAQSGARQEEWSDECMNQLISAVEIAIDEDWGDVVEALTDTARLLHSYEDAGHAQRCVPFLGDSYEILCLMVGDLIVDNVRPSVMEKWRRCFQAAMDDLHTQGLRLIQDDEQLESPHMAPSNQDEPGAPERDMMTSDESAPFAGARDDARPATLDDDLPALDDLPPMQGAERVGMESVARHVDTEESALEPIQAMGDDPGDSLDSLPEMPVFGNVGYLPTDPESAPFSRHPRPVRDMPDGKPSAPKHHAADSRDERIQAYQDLEVEGELINLGEIEPVHAQQAEPEGSAADDVGAEPHGPLPAERLEPAVVQHLDALCDELTRLESATADDQIDHGVIFATIEARLDSLRNHAHSGHRTGAKRLSETMLALCRHVGEHPADMQDKFFELAFAFCGLYADCDDGEESAIENSWYNEVAALHEKAEPFAEPNEDEADAEMVEPLDLSIEADAADRGIDEETAAIYDDEHSDAIDEPEQRGHPERSEESCPNGTLPVEEILHYVQTASDDGGASHEIGPATAADVLMGLLGEAQQAAAHGDIAHAKVLALKAAVKIAEAEVDQAEHALAAIDHRLGTNGQAVEDAHISAAGAEAQLGECERRVADVESAISETRERAAETRGQLENVQRHVEDIERQIRALEAERDAEVAKATGIEAELDQQRQTEQSELASLEQCREEERTARRRLESVRQEIENLERQRESAEADKTGAAATVDDKRASLADIEQTVRLIQARMNDSNA